MCTDEERIYLSIKEVLIVGFWCCLCLAILFPVLGILTFLNVPKIYLYIMIVIGFLGPFFEIERRRNDVNLKKQHEEDMRWINFAKMKRPNWPHDKHLPLTEEDRKKYLYPLFE